MDFDYAFMLSKLPLFIQAGKLTIQLGAGAICLSVVLGGLCAVLGYYKVRYVQNLISAYIELSRNTPLLIQIYFLYFGLPAIGIKLNSITCAVIGLTFLGASYMSEAIRAGLEAVQKSQIEAGEALGLSKWHVLRFIIAPQALAVATPALSANFIFLLKETSIVGAIAVPELLHTTNSLMAIYFKTYELMTMLTIAYLVIILPVSVICRLWERRIKHAQFGN